MQRLIHPAAASRNGAYFQGRFGNFLLTTVLADASLRKAAFFGDWGALRRKMQRFG